MAFYMLCAAEAIFWAIGLYSLYVYGRILQKALPAQRAFIQTHTKVSRVQTLQGMLFLSLFMMVFDLLLAAFASDWLERLCFLGIAVLFAAYSIKNYVQGRILWDQQSFIWENHTRKFASIRNFEEINRQCTELVFAKQAHLTMPAATALQLQSLKARPASSR